MLPPVLQLPLLLSRLPRLRLGKGATTKLAETVGAAGCEGGRGYWAGASGRGRGWAAEAAGCPGRATGDRGRGAGTVAGPLPLGCSSRHCRGWGGWVGCCDRASSFCTGAPSSADGSIGSAAVAAGASVRTTVAAATAAGLAAAGVGPFAFLGGASGAGLSVTAAGRTSPLCCLTVVAPACQPAAALPCLSVSAAVPAACCRPAGQVLPRLLPPLLSSAVMQASRPPRPSPAAPAVMRSRAAGE